VRGSVIQRFVVPCADGPVTGGTLYNGALLRALRALHFPCNALDLDGARSALARAEPGFYWVDTLNLARIGQLAAANRSGQPIGLLTHYLPSLVGKGAALDRSRLSREEAFAIHCATAFLTPSRFMQRTLERLGAGRRPVIVVEPGCDLVAVKAARRRRGLHALLVANVVAAKGVEPFLRALGRMLRPSDSLQLVVLGSLDREPRYAARCCRLVAEDTGLRPRVSLCGAVAHETVWKHLAHADLLVSSSRMEAYGMAIAEARRAGLPILACDGGNVRALVAADAGGELVKGPTDLARACLGLCRSPAEHNARLALARKGAPAPRAWLDAARELIDQLHAIPGAYPLRGARAKDQ
jgi:glycosyltransferase involved in cell wall biosynthesis